MQDDFSTKLDDFSTSFLNIINFIVFTLIALFLYGGNNWGPSSLNPIFAPFFFAFIVYFGRYIIINSVFVINKFIKSNILRVILYILISLFLQKQGYDLLYNFTHEKIDNESSEDKYLNRIKLKNYRLKNLYNYKLEYEKLSKKGELFLPNKQQYFRDSIKIINYFNHLLNLNYQTLIRDSVINSTFCNLFDTRLSTDKDSVFSKVFIDSIKSSIKLFRIVYSEDFKQLVFFVGYNYKSEIITNKKEDFGECLMYYGVKKDSNIYFFKIYENIMLNDIPNKELAFYFFYSYWTGIRNLDLNFYPNDRVYINNKEFWQRKNAFNYFKNNIIFKI